MITTDTSHGFLKTNDARLQVHDLSIYIEFYSDNIFLWKWYKHVMQHSQKKKSISDQC